MPSTRLSVKAKQTTAKYYGLLAKERGCTKEQCKEVARFAWGLTDQLDRKKLTRKQYMDELDAALKSRIQYLSEHAPPA